MNGLDATHDPGACSWLPSANGHPDFPIQNLPLCIFATPADSTDRRGGIRIADHLLDLRALASSGLLSGPGQAGAEAATTDGLNAFFGLGAPPRADLRRQVHSLLLDGSPHRSEVQPLLRPIEVCVTYLPARIGDYSDFYAGIHHARHVGGLFRPDNPLLPNYRWVPIGYHGRASTVQPDGAPVRRPRGQTKLPGAAIPTFGPCAQLDFELELGVWTTGSPTPGKVLTIDRAHEQVAGYCLLNDWSARDIQSWEYQPLGPFLAKSFATTVSNYVVTPEALAPYRLRLDRPAGDPRPLAYLSDAEDLAHGGLDVDLEVAMSTDATRTQGQGDVTVTVTSTRHLYWTVAQLITHHVSGGCELQPGDLLGTGTISAPDRTGPGSLLELTDGGRRPVRLPSGQTRTFLEDGDEVVLRARASRADAAPVGFGECRARILPAPMAECAL